MAESHALMLRLCLVYLCSKTLKYSPWPVCCLLKCTFPFRMCLQEQVFPVFKLGNLVLQMSKEAYLKLFFVHLTLLCPEYCLFFFFSTRNRLGPKRKTFTLKQRIFMLLLLGVIGFFTLIIIMAKVGRASADEDPNLDPMLNPHIRVGNMWTECRSCSSKRVRSAVGLFWGLGPMHKMPVLGVGMLIQSLPVEKSSS